MCFGYYYQVRPWSLGGGDSIAWGHGQADSLEFGVFRASTGGGLVKFKVDHGVGGFAAIECAHVSSPED